MKVTNRSYPHQNRDKLQNTKTNTHSWPSQQLCLKLTLIGLDKWYYSFRARDILGGVFSYSLFKYQLFLRHFSWKFLRKENYRQLLTHRNNLFWDEVNEKCLSSWHNLSFNCRHWYLGAACDIFSEILEKKHLSFFLEEISEEQDT